MSYFVHNKKQVCHSLLGQNVYFTDGASGGAYIVNSEKEPQFWSICGTSNQSTDCCVDSMWMHIMDIVIHDVGKSAV